MTSAPTASTPQELYQIIKAAEPNTPSLNPRSTVVIGTLDQSADVFNWAIPYYEPSPTLAALSPRIENPVGPQSPFHPAPPGSYYLASPGSILVTLRFQVVNRSGEFSVGGFGQAVSAPADQSYVDLVLEEILSPGHNTVSCLLQYGTAGDTRSFSAAFVILQLPVAAAGAFTIPVLPLSIVYAPPQPATSTSASKFTTSYQWTTTSARAVTTSVSSTTSAKTATNYTAPTLLTAISTTITELTTISGLIGGGGSATPVAPVAAVASASTSAPPSSTSSPSGASTYITGITALLNLISQNINSNTVSGQSGLQVTSSNKMTITNTYQQTSTTVPGLGRGPGDGDIFIWIYDVLVAWLAVNGELGICVLDYQGETLATAQDLRAGNTGLDTAIVNELLQLDPFTQGRVDAVTGNLSYYLSPERFMPNSQPPDIQLYDNAPDAGFIQYTITEEDTQASIQTQTTIKDFKPGFLESVFGDNETTEGTVTTSYSTTDDTTVGSTIQDQYNFQVAQGDPPYLVDVWYDRLFGTIAFVVTGQETQQPVFPVVHRAPALPVSEPFSS
jgi:hypothetical protein